MLRNDLSILSAFLVIAEERSFTKAAKRFGVSPSALSHTIKGLEERIGVRLLSRTTRSVAPTEAREQLLVRLRPALSDVQDAVDQVSGLRDKAAGRVRLLIPRLAGTTVLGTKLANFTRDYPEVVLDITADDSRRPEYFKSHPKPQRLTIFASIAASISGMELPAYTAGVRERQEIRVRCREWASHRRRRGDLDSRRNRWCRPRFRLR